MSLNNESYGYLLSPHIQIMDHNGNPMTGAFLKVFEAGSSYTQVTTYSDWEGTAQPANKELDARGEVVIIASKSINYKVMLCDYTRGVDNPYWVLNNVSIESSSVLPGNVVVQVNGTTGEIDSTLTLDEEGNKIYTESLSSTIKTTIETNTSDIGGIQVHINNIDESITSINQEIVTINNDIDVIQSDIETVDNEVEALKLSDQYTTFKATSAAGSGGYTFKIATALKTKAPLTSTTILEYDLTNNYLGKINAAWGMRGHVVYQQIMQMDDQYTAVDYMHYTHLYEFPDRWELWGQTEAGWAGDISIRPSKNISIAITVHVNPWVFVGKAVSASLPTVYTEHNWVDYTQPVNDSKKTSVWAAVEGTSDHKVMIDANDQGAKYLNDKILVGGILSKAIEAAGEVGDWYEVLRLTATLYTDGVTISGAGTSEDPLVALSDHESFINIDDTNSPYLIPESVDEIIVSTATDDVVVTLPVTSLKRFYVKWLLGTHNLTVNVADSGMIDGVASFVFNDKFSVGTSVSFVCKESGDWIANGTITDGQVDTYKAMCSTGDIPGYLENKLVGSTWINASNIPLNANEKNIMFALKNPDFFIKGNTIYGGQVVGVIGDLDEQSHNGYYTCYHSTLHAPPAQPGNPSWFIHHMNSNTANYYAVQIAYAYTSTIICYERTKVAGVWQAWILRSSGSSEVAHIATGDSLGAKDIIQLQAGSSTQWSAHAAMCSTIGAITPGILSEMGFIATQVVTGNFIIAAYKVETNLAHSLICATGVTAFPSLAGWINTPVLNHVKSIAANDRVYLVVLTDSNGVAMAGASCTTFNIQPYVAGIKTNMGVLTEAPATLTFDSETTSRPFIYMVK